MKKILKLIISGLVSSSILLSGINVFAQTQTKVVRVTLNKNVASVDNQNVTLSVAPYIQKPSESMMIPLKFVSTALGIPEENIKFNPTTKEVTINYNNTFAKFIAGTNKLILNGNSYDMIIDSKYPVYTEIKNGSTFIPLRSLELAFSGIKIDWEASTKTAILKNEIEIVDDKLEETENKELTEQEIRAMEEEVVRLVNEERAKYNLHPLEIDETLMKLSREKSEDMYINNYFSHISEKLGAPADVITSNGLEFTWMGENIAKGQKTPSEVVQDWMNSKGHRENILSPNAKYIGIGYFGGVEDVQINSYKGIEIKKDYVTYWTQQFIG